MLFKVNVVLFTFDALAGGIIALWKSVVITVKVEIGGAAAQIVLREVADKRRLYTTRLPFHSLPSIRSPYGRCPPRPSPLSPDDETHTFLLVPSYNPTSILTQVTTLDSIL